MDDPQCSPPDGNIITVGSKLMKSRESIQHGDSLSNMTCTQKGREQAEEVERFLTPLIQAIYSQLGAMPSAPSEATSFYASHCSFMGIARSQTSAANHVATTSHAMILDAQAKIVRSEKDIPVTMKELVDHNRNKWLKAVMGDIKVTTMILKSTDCGAKKFLQLENSDEKHGGNPRLEIGSGSDRDGVSAVRWPGSRGKHLR